MSSRLLIVTILLDAVDGSKIQPIWVMLIWSTLPIPMLSDCILLRQDMDSSSLTLSRHTSQMLKLQF